MMIPTLFTVSYAGFWGQDKLSLSDACRKVKELGYDAVEIMGKRPHLSMVDTKMEEVKELKKLLDDLGIQVASVASYTNFTGGLESPEVPFVEIQLGYIKRLAEFTQVLGGKVIRVFTGYSQTRLTHDAEWARCVDAVRQACQVVAPYGLTIGVQNHHDIGVGVDSYEDLLNEVNQPNCAAMFDAWSVALQGADLYTWAKRMAPRMVQTTVADYVLRPRFHHAGDLVNYQPMPTATRAAVLGEGFIDYATFFKGLKEGGFNGYVSYEMCSPLLGGGSLANLDRTARKSLEAMKKLIG